MLYDNNDGRFYEKLELIADLIADLSQSDKLGLKIASKWDHLGIGGNNLNLEEDEGLRRRTSVSKVTKHHERVGGSLWEGIRPWRTS